MARLILTLALVLYQAQPLAAVLLCQQHEAMSHAACNEMATADGAAWAAGSDAGQMTGCGALSHCATPAPVAVPAAGAMIAAADLSQGGAPTLATRPIESNRAPPFHPPKA
jgi:hypothetical protein